MNNFGERLKTVGSKIADWATKGEEGKLLKAFQPAKYPREGQSSFSKDADKIINKGGVR